MCADSWATAQYFAVVPCAFRKDFPALNMQLLQQQLAITYSIESGVSAIGYRR
jgi:hypothetical protein